ncbi:helix-turn-helix domain-containing protein [Chitinophaga sp. 212800010-3]|uniref:AraC family transcriptional regulator n=1 Tax=unclassified Chitinophaga TaxID=2619133 RepID=UPI002DE86BBD|nr:HTH araC/xylS-type domain-containing protein [Chitinophaga sp. 212800010-3]
MLFFNTQHLEFEPPEALRDSIKCFWYERKAPAVFEVLPDGYAEIIFHFGNTCSIFFNGSLQPLPSPFIMGLLNQPVLVNTKACLEIIGIRCYPWTVFDLLGLSSGKDSVHIFEHPIARLHATLNKYVHAGRIDEAVTYLKEYFLYKRLPMAVDSTLFKAGIAMREANGAIPVSRIAAAAHTTVRTLERKFKQSSGYTVKDVSGLIRFEQVRNQLWHYPDVNIAGLAHELGYTDQSHLSREFKRYTGITPAAFARKHK